MSVPYPLPSFPSRAAFTDVAYAGLYIEPVIGSGERLCFGVVVERGAVKRVVSVPAIRRLSKVYGPAARALSFAIEMAETAVTTAIDKARLSELTGWRSPVEGVFLGPIRATCTLNLEDAIRVALSQCASLYELPDSALGAEDEATRRRLAGATVARLERSIVEGVVSKRPELRAAFDKEFRVSEHARPTRVGFVRGRLAANFALLAPRNLRGLSDTAKARLLELERLRDNTHEDLLESPQQTSFQLFLQRVTLANVEYSEAQIAQVDEASEELEVLSRGSAIGYHAFSASEGIVEALLAAAA